MKLDPQTPIAALLRAIPSSAAVLGRFGIPSNPSEARTLQQACNDHNVGIEEFLGALDEIDWNAEPAETPDSDKL